MDFLPVKKRLCSAVALKKTAFSPLLDFLRATAIAIFRRKQSSSNVDKNVKAEILSERFQLSLFSDEAAPLYARRPFLIFLSFPEFYPTDGQ